MAWKGVTELLLPPSGESMFTCDPNSFFPQEEFNTSVLDIPAWTI